MDRSNMTGLAVKIGIATASIAIGATIGAATIAIYLYVTVTNNT